jgi:hypothetical protein
MQASIHLRDRDFGSGRGACWTAPEPEAAMNRLVLFAILFCGPAFARDDGRYSNSPLKEWFDRLAERAYVAPLLTDMWLKIPTGNRVTVTIKFVLITNGSMFRTMPLSPSRINSAGRWCGRCGTAKV